MKLKSFLPVLLAILLVNCSHPEDRLVGVWEYDSYEADESGIGIIAAYIPDDWKKPVDEWIEKTKGLTTSELTFNADGTYTEAFSGAAKEFTTIKGYYTVTPDFKELRLKHNGTEQALKLVELTETYFIYQKEFTKYKVPLTLNISYKRVK